MYKPKHSFGLCELCGKTSNELERHHVKYKPERTIFLCHDCHFMAHFQPFRLTNEQLKILILRGFNEHEKELMIKNRELLDKLIRTIRKNISVYYDIVTPQRPKQSKKENY